MLAHRDRVPAPSSTVQGRFRPKRQAFQLDGESKTETSLTVCDSGFPKPGSRARLTDEVRRITAKIGAWGANHDRAL
jgi:hypothetical protein